MKFEYVDVERLGFYHIDENGNEVFVEDNGTEKIDACYGFFCGHRKIGNLVEYIRTHAKLTADVQRFADEVKIGDCSDKLFGLITLGGRVRDEDTEGRLPINLAINGIVDVKSDAVTRVIKKVINGKVQPVLQLLIPTDEEAMAKYYQYYYILDGQHSSCAMSDAFGHWGTDTTADHKSFFYLYLDLDVAKRTAIYDNKNFQATRASTIQELQHLYLREEMTEDEHFCYAMIDALAAERLQMSDGTRNFSFMHKRIKNDETCRSNMINPLIIMRYTMYKGNKNKNKRYVVREDNLIRSMSNPKFDFQRDPKVYAAKFDLFARCFSQIHGDDGDEIINMFVVNKTKKVSATKAAAAYSMAQAVADVIAAKDGLHWNAESIYGVSAVLRDNVFGGQMLIHTTEFINGGGSDMLKIAAQWRKDLVAVCECLSAEEIISMGQMQ